MRRVVLFVVLVALGVGLNVLSVWVCARMSKLGSTVTLDVYGAVTRVPELADEFLNDPGYLVSFGGDRKTGLGHLTSGDVWHTETAYKRWVNHEIYYSRSHMFVGFGVPFRSMMYEQQGSHRMAAFPGFVDWRIPGRRGGWPIAPEISQQDALWGYGEPRHVYPLTILPSGFAVNSAFYAWALAVLVWGWSCLRARRRRGLGLCVKCCYPRGATAMCSECGYIAGA